MEVHEEGFRGSIRFFNQGKSQGGTFVKVEGMNPIAVKSRGCPSQRTEMRQYGR